MNETVKTFLYQWNRNNDERRKLQQTYFSVAFVGLIAAGLVSLVSEEASRYMLYVVYALVVAYFINAISWALLSSLIIDRIKKPRTTTRKK